jgi:RES domain-containing protein
MAGSGRARDVQLLDAIDALATQPFRGNVWRVVREGRDPLSGSAVGGRWDDRSFDVLYTAREASGAIAEVYFHLSRGQPVVPSKVKYTLFEIGVELESCLPLPTMEDLARLGLRTELYGQLSYDEKVQEYPRSQEIAEVAYFLGHEGLLVPSARHDTTNLVVFSGRIAPDRLTAVKCHGIVDWDQRYSK